MHHIKCGFKGTGLNMAIEKKASTAVRLRSTDSAEAEKELREKLRVLEETLKALERAKSVRQESLQEEFSI
jgi:hypothetical protein